MANSRVRCAIVMDSEFAITKLPTKSATPAKTSRKMRKKEMNSSVSDASSAACSELDSTCASGGRTFSIDSISCSVETPGLRGDRDLVELAGLVEQPLRGLEVEAGERGAADRGDRAELDETRDAEPLDRADALHADRVADLVVLLAGRRLVDHDLVRLRPGALDERERVEARVAVRDAEAEVRRAAVDDRLAVVADQRRGAVDAALGLRDAVDRRAPRRAASTGKVGALEPLSSLRDRRRTCR